MRPADARPPRARLPAACSGIRYHPGNPMKTLNPFPAPLAHALSALGIAASGAATRLLRSQLFGVQPTDPLAYAVVVLMLGLVTLVACYIPARRAASVDPIVALRQE